MDGDGGPEAHAAVTLIAGKTAGDVGVDFLEMARGLERHAASLRSRSRQDAKVPKYLWRQRAIFD